MSRGWLLFLHFIFAFQVSAAPSPLKPHIDPNPTVRVRLKSFPLHKLEVIGSRLQINGDTVSERELQISRVSADWVVSAKARTDRRFDTNELLVVGESLIIDGAFVPSSILLTQREKKLDVIALLPLETYLEGVVAAEIPNSWPHEAQKAQAIAARTFTLNKIRERRKSSFDVDASVMDQVFKFKRYESLSPSQKAVRETRGEFIANNLGIIEPIYYHASCGGSTDGADKVWGQGASRKPATAVTDSCALNTKVEWVAEVSKSELFDKLRTALKLNRDTELVRIEPQQKALSGRVLRLALVTSSGTQTITGELLRSLLGYSKIKSTKFSVERVDDRFVFTGRGLGHGVGMCQWGARDLAIKGKSARQILLHYFPSSLLKHLVVSN